MRKLLLFAVFTYCTLMLNAQTDALPANPEPGKCYVKCVTPDVYETTEEKIMVSPEYKVLKIVPAEYKDVEEKIMIKEASKRYEIIPAEYKTEYKEYDKVEGHNILSIVAAKLGNDTKSIEVHPAVQKWEYQTYSGCKSEDPLDCRVLCWKEYPAQTKDVPIKVLATNATTNAKPSPKKTDKIKVRVVSRAAEVKEIEIPAEYKIVKRRVLVKDETVVEEVVPAKYEMVKKEVLKNKGGVTVWEEIECELLEYSVLPILYDLNSAKITSASRSVIDKNLLKLMKDKPNVKVEISSHTDSRGSNASNKDLSERRAQSVVNYLINKGINSSRLVAKGYGEERLKNRCADGVSCTEKEHHANRRTEFRILNY